MKTVIRGGVFETNSSSTHSIMIQKNHPIGPSDRWTVEEGLEQLRAMGAKVIGKLDSWSGMTLDLTPIDEDLASFQRTEEAYNTFGMKLLYAIASFKNDKFLWDALMNYLEGIGIKTLKTCVEYSKYSHEGETLGDIDHDSVFALGEIFGRGIRFDDYITRKDIYLVIDNEG